MLLSASGSAAASADIGERKRQRDIGTCGGDAGEPPRPAAMSVTLVQAEESQRNPAIMTLAVLWNQ